MVKATVDTKQVEVNLTKLAPLLKEKLARSMAVAGAKVIRDEASLRASQGPTGNLKDSMYVAGNEGATTKDKVVYSVSWNKIKAPHGHLIEFGHWMYFQRVKIDGEWVTLKNRPLATPRKAPAKPFLRPAYEAKKDEAYQAMIARARMRFKELMSGAIFESGPPPARAGVPNAT